MSPLWQSAPDVSGDAITRMRGLKNLVGNTPLLAIAYTWRNEPRVLYAKWEIQNLTSSVKDRVALHVIRRGYERGVLQRGSPILVASPGNSGVSFAAVGRAMGHPVTVVLPASAGDGRADLIRSFGAEVCVADQPEADLRGCRRVAERMAANVDGAFLAHQLDPGIGAEAHARTTGPEIWSQLYSHALKPDVFVATVGTGSTLTGIGRFLRAMQPGIHLHPVEMERPDGVMGSSAMRCGIEGLNGNGKRPAVDLAGLEEDLPVGETDAIRMAQLLASVLGLPVGISSGANFLGAVRAQSRWGKTANVVTLFPDTSRNYLQAGLGETVPAEETHLTSGIRLLGYRAQNRTCEACADVDAF